MLVGLLLASAWVTVAYAEHCRPDSDNAFKVRLSIKTALGDNAYGWDATEEYLFKAMVAFAMRRSSNQKATQISNVLLCNVTERVSFWFVVTDSSTNTTVPKGDVEAAIRVSRNRINSAFLLDDNTLQFLQISTTLAPPVEPSVPTWLIVFGVVLCLVVVGVVVLVTSGIHQHRRHNKEPEETESLEEKCETTITMENGIPCDTLDLKAGQINGVYAAADDERFTPL